MVPRYGTPRSYKPRVLDQELATLLGSLPAIAIEGAKGVGKTLTATRLSRTIHALDEPGLREVARGDPVLLTRGEPPVLLDEWQRFPESWDLVRRAVDADPSPGRFLLTGSSSPVQTGTHSGAGRIVRLHMRPLSLFERGVARPAVGLAELLSGSRPSVAGRTPVTLEEYAAEICSSGFPGMRGVSGRALRAQLDGYLHRIVDREFPEMGRSPRRPATLRRWMAAYAAATATTASYETIRDAATPGNAEKPSKTTTAAYMDILERLWIVEPLPAWAPTRNPFSRLVASPKHHLVDPALAARLLGADVESLLEARPLGPKVAREGTLLGRLFESLVCLDVRVYAQAAEAWVGHLRSHTGGLEADLVVERPDHRVLAIEVKLAVSVSDDDVRPLQRLRERLGDQLLDAVVVTTGREAYRRRDGICVVPAALLGP